MCVLCVCVCFVCACFVCVCFLCVCVFCVCDGGRFVTHEQRGSTPLIQTAVMGHAECMRMLLDAGADKEAKATKVCVDGCGCGCLWVWM